MILGITIQSWGSFTVYATSYLRTVDFGLQYEDTAWVTAITGGLVGFTSYLGGWLLEWKGPRLTSLIGGIVVSAGICMSALSIQQGYLAFIFSYSFVVGLGCGIIYSSPMQAVMRWFPEMRGFITGFVMCGSSVGPMVAVSLQTWLVNPENLKPQTKDGTDLYFTNAQLLERVPASMYVVGCFSLLLSFVGAYLIAEPPKAEVSDSGADTEERQPLIGRPQRLDITPSEVLAIREFWLMWFCYFFNMLSVNFAMNNVKVFGQNQGADLSDHKLTSVVSGAALFNGLGRLGWGHVADKYTFRFAIFWMSIVKAFCIATLASSAQMGYAVYFLSVAALFSCVGGVSSIWAGATSLYFGAEHFGRNFGLMTIAGGCGWIVGAAFFQFANKHYSDEFIALCSGGFSLVAAICGYLLRECDDFWNSNSKQLTRL